MGSSKKEEHEINEGLQQEEQKGSTKFVDITAAKRYCESQQKDRQRSTPKQNFKVSRNLMGNLTPVHPTEGNLFSLLSTEEVAKARSLNEQGKLFSILTDGIAGGGMVKKAALYLAREIYQQASAYGDPIKEGFSELARRGHELGFSASRKIGEVVMPSLFIKITLSEATKWIKGANNSANREDIDTILHKLAENWVYWRSPDEKEHIKAKMITIEAEYTNERTRQKEYLIEVRPQFYMGISSGFVTASERSTTLLPKLKKDIDMNLFLYVLQLFSYKGEKGYPVIKRSKDKVEERVVPPHYIKGSKKSRLSKEFGEAVNKLIEGGLLLSKGVATELGSDGKTYFYVFYLNPYYDKTTNNYIN